MKAAIYDRYGPPEVLHIADVNKPAPSAGEVLVRIAATVATPPDLAMRSATPFIVRFFAGLFRPKLRILGTTLAGVVEAVGPGVTRFVLGDRVYAATEAGTYAEHAVVKEDSAIAKMADGITFAEAAGLCEGFLTAMPFLRDEAKLKAGQKILINGVAGSIGTIAVQLAKNMGAHVTGVCSTRNIELATSLGADAIIDYTREDFSARRAEWDVIFDAVGKSSFGRCRAALTPGGVYMTTVPTWSIVWPMLRGKGSDGKRGLLATTGLRKPADKVRDLELLSEMVARKELRVVIDRTYPLEEIADAHRYVATERKRGSVVIQIAMSKIGSVV